MRCPLLFIFFVSLSLAQDNRYTFQDLQSLYDSGEEEEFLLHAKDIKPAERGPRWKKMVSDLTKKRVETLLNKKSISLDEMKKIDELGHWPSNKADLTIQAKILELGHKFISTSWKDLNLLSAEQINLQRSFWDLHWASTTKNPAYLYRYARFFHDLKVQFANLPPDKQSAVLGSDLTLEATVNTLLDQAYKSSMGAELCRDPWVWTYLLPSIREFAQNFKKRDLEEFDLKIANRFSLSCWKSARVLLLNTLPNLALADRHLALHLLGFDRSLDPLDKYFVHIYYLLGSPMQTELATPSWETLQQLSQNEPMRSKLLDKLLSLDPLPGEVFAESNTEHADLIIRRFSQLFPEYLDAYAKVCYSYLSGQKVYPRGNPTPQCFPFCRRYRKMDLTFFAKPLYQVIPQKSLGQCQ